MLFPGIPGNDLSECLMCNQLRAFPYIQRLVVGFCFCKAGLIDMAKMSANLATQRGGWFCSESSRRGLE